MTETAEKIAHSLVKSSDRWNVNRHYVWHPGGVAIWYCNGRGHLSVFHYPRRLALVDFYENSDSDRSEWRPSPLDRYRIWRALWGFRQEIRFRTQARISECLDAPILRAVA